MCALIAKNAHDCSKHLKHSMLTKESIKHRSLRGVRKAPQIIVPNVPNRKYFRYRLAGDFLQVINFWTNSLFCAISAVFAVLRISVM